MVALEIWRLLLEIFYFPIVQVSILKKCYSTYLCTVFIIEKLRLELLSFLPNMQNCFQITSKLIFYSDQYRYHDQMNFLKPSALKNSPYTYNPQCPVYLQIRISPLSVFVVCFFRCHSLCHNLTISLLILKFRCILIM